MENQNNNIQSNNNQQNNKSKIVLSYIIPLIGLIFVLSEKNATSIEKRNYAQAATLFILDIILFIISLLIGFIGIPFIGTIISFLPTVLFIFAIIAAIKSDSTEIYKIPAIYDLSEKIFK
ncbi:MAG: hypothetical protein Q4D02_00650 [Clostridia bacterium]|nr:hypothetical protein [Clostridia bacterium]